MKCQGFEQEILVVYVWVSGLCGPHSCHHGLTMPCVPALAVVILHSSCGLPFKTSFQGTQDNVNGLKMYRKIESDHFLTWSFPQRLLKDYTVHIFIVGMRLFCGAHSTTALLDELIRAFVWIVCIVSCPSERRVDSKPPALFCPLSGGCIVAVVVLVTEP